MCRLRVAPRDGEPQAAKFAGGHRSRVPPVPIPNTEVKPATADGTVWETVWESRSLPALFLEPAVRNHSGLFLCTPVRYRAGCGCSTRWRTTVTIKSTSAG